MSLHYLEQWLAHWVMSHGAMVLMIPSFCDRCSGSGHDIPVFDYAQYLDSLILQRGPAVDPDRLQSDTRRVPACRPERQAIAQTTSWPLRSRIRPKHNSYRSRGLASVCPGPL